MELSVLKYTGEETGRTILLPNSVFGIQPHDHAIYLDVKCIMANKRQGTHKTKERGEVSGSRKKIRKQKGTGCARAGDIKSPLFRGGGRIFGPKPRDYGVKLNKKVKKLARKSVLSYKMKEGAITLLEPFSFETPVTKNYVLFLQNLKLQKEKTLLILTKVDKNILLASRNLEKAKVILVDQMNTYDLLNATQLLISEYAVEEIVKKMI